MKKQPSGTPHAYFSSPSLHKVAQKPITLNSIKKPINTKLMETFYDVIAGDQLVLVDFFATWCQPCKMMHPVLQQVKEVLGDRIRIIKIDVDTHAALSQQYQIQSVPTLMLFRKGEVLWRMSGAMPKAELLSNLDPFLR